MSCLKAKFAVGLILFWSAAVLPASAATDENGAGAGGSAPVVTDDATAGGEYKRTVENLYEACAAEKAVATSWCSAYLIGVADTLSAFSGHKAGLCGATYKIEQLGPIFMKWTRAHPNLKNLDMLAGASLAFREQWPCS